MSNWFYADANGSRQGPADGTDLARWLGEGRLHWGTLVWRDGMADWQPMADFADEFTALAGGAAPGAMASAVPDDTVGARAATASAPPSTVDSHSPYAAPSAPLLSANAVHRGNDVVYAGFRKRVAAYVIDAFILAIACYAVQIPLLLGVFGTAALSGGTPDLGSGTTIVTLLAVYLVPIAIQMVYYAWFHASARQATPGKMAVGIKVVDDAGAPISFARGVGRYFAFLLSGFTVGIGYLMAAFTDRKRGLHDMIASTLVVDRWAYTDRPELQSRQLGAVTVVVLVLGGLMFVGIVFAMIALGVSMAGAFNR